MDGIPEVTIPDLPQTGADAKAFVPKGWKLTDQVSGDLNGDGKKDLVFILQDQDPKNIVGDVQTNTNPRILAVAFANAKGAGYTLAHENSTFLCRYTSSDVMWQDQSDASISYARGAIKVDIPTADDRASHISTKTFIFRFQHSRFELIGYDIFANSGMGGGHDDYNYSTHREIATQYDSSGKAVTTTTALLATLLPGMDDIGSFDAWDGTKSTPN